MAIAKKCGICQQNNIPNKIHAGASKLPVAATQPPTGGNAPGYQGDYVTGVGLEGGGGVGPTGRTLANDLAAEAYTITSDTQIDPNTGGNMPGYQGDYVRPAAEYGEKISTIVNLTEEFLGENTDSGKTTITEPSTTTKSSVVTSVATRCTANCGG